MNQTIEISSRTIIFTVLFLILLKVVWLSRELIYGLFLAFIFMSALKPSVNSLERRKVPRALAAFMVFITALVVIVFLIAFIIPPVITESLIFFKNLPILIGQAIPQLGVFVNGDSWVRFIPDITQNFVKIVGGIFSNLIFIISTLFFTLYFLMEEKFLRNFLMRFLEEKQVDRVVDIVSKAEMRMGAWVWGQIILMTAIGVVSYIGLSILQVRYALPLAVLAGLLEVVPIIGPTLSVIPAFFVSASVSWVSGLPVIILYFIIQQLENNLIVPIVMKRTVGLHPIMTLIALSIGGTLGGFLGIILSVPVALFLETLLIEVSKIRK